MLRHTFICLFWRQPWVATKEFAIRDKSIVTLVMGPVRIVHILRLLARLVKVQVLKKRHGVDLFSRNLAILVPELARLIHTRAQNAVARKLQRLTKILS